MGPWLQPRPNRSRDDLEAAPSANPRRWAILAVLCTSLLLVMLGNTALNLALPNIAADLGLSSSAQQWVVDSYSLVFAVCCSRRVRSAIASAARA